MAKLEIDDTVLMVDRLKEANLTEKEKSFVFSLDLRLLQGIPLTLKQKIWLQRLEGDYL
jgi:hypothetical protein